MFHALLVFSEDTGKWCIGGDCSEEGDDVEPMGLHLGALDATPVSDFDGKFEAKGVGPPGGLLGSAAVPQVKPPPPPRRPKAPKKPALETFEPEMPKYSDKCVGYGDLWKKVQETVFNDAGEEEATANELDTEEESAAGYKNVHPCDLAGQFGGIRSKYAGGDGKPTGKAMPYDELTGCFDRFGKGSYQAAKAMKYVDLIMNRMGLSHSIQATVCAFAPEIITSPMGFGASADLGDTCKAIVTVGFTAFTFVKEVALYDQLDAISEAQASDCQPNQANFARVFCDMHCIRDAVIRGDRTILRNLKKATDITNSNTEKLAEWIVKTQQLDAGWLAEKIDHQSLVQSMENNKEFTAIKELLEGGDRQQMLLAIKQQTQKIQAELRGYVDGSSFGRASALAASDALEKFSTDGKSSLKDGFNSSQHVFAAFDNLISLRAKLRTASDQRSKAEHVGMSVVQMARQ
ncbi:ANKRD50, partial [Symbiodinium natans]